MKYYFLILRFSVFLISFSIQAQSKEAYYKQWRIQMDTITNIDSRLQLSLDMVLKVNDINKTEIYKHLGQIYSQKRITDSSYFYYKKAIALGESQGEPAEEYLGLAYVHFADELIEENKSKEAKILLKKAKIILNRNQDHEAWSQYYTSNAFLVEKEGELAKSITYMDSAVVFNIKKKDSSKLAASYHNRGFYHYNLLQYEDAVKDLLLAIGLNEKFNELSNLVGNYYILSACYVALKQNEIAVKYSKKGVEVSKKLEYDFVTSLNYSILSESYRNLNKTEKALVATDSMLVYAYKINDNAQIAQGLTDKAGIHLSNTNDYDKAEKYYLQAYEIVKTHDIEIYKNPILGGLFEVYLVTNNYTKALKFLKLQDVHVKKLNSKPVSVNIYESYAQYYEKTGQPDLALKYLRKYYTLKDSISSEKVKIQVANLEKQYDTKSKELQIVKLDKEKKDQQQLTAEAKTKQNLYLLSAIVLFLLLLLGYWLFRKLKTQKEELDATNKVKNRLFSIISHDLRSMIIPFQRSGRILQHYIENKNYDKTIMFSQELQKNSEGLSSMLDNLLSWSIEQMNGYKMNPELLYVKQELEVLKANFNQQAEFKNTKISILAKEEVGLTLDKGAFHIIFRNLIGNALKYTENGSIRLEIKRALNILNFAIIDTGIGMSQEQLAQLFILENKKSSTGTKGEKGTGLGLNLVYRFITLNGGTIKVSSEKRVGTKFDLSFPLSENDILETQKANKIDLSA